MVILSACLSADPINDIKSQLIGMITKELIQKKEIKVCAFDEEYKKLKGDAFHFKLVDTCEETDLIITQSMSHIPLECQNNKALILMTKYQEYKKSSLPIGALFWQKGRPNLIFSVTRFQELSLAIPPSFDQYME